MPYFFESRVRGRIELELADCTRDGLQERRDVSVELRAWTRRTVRQLGSTVTEDGASEQP